MIHLRPVPRRYSFLNDQAYVDTHRRLRMEIEEEALSQEIVDRHNERIRRNRIYKQTGEIA